MDKPDKVLIKGALGEVGAVTCGGDPSDASHREVSLSVRDGWMVFDASNPPTQLIAALQAANAWLQ